MADTKISALPASTTPLAGTEVLPIVQSGTTKQVSVANLTAGRSVSAASLTLTGTALTVANGGTGLASLSAGYIPFGNSASAMTSSGDLTFASNVLEVFSVVSARSGSGTAALRLRSNVSYFEWRANTGVNNLVMYDGGTGFDLLTLNATTYDFTINRGNQIFSQLKGVNFTGNTAAAGMTSQLLNWYEEGTWTPAQGGGLTVVGAFSSTGRYTRIGRQVTVSGTVTGATSVAVTAAGIVTTNLPFTVVTAGHGNATNAAVNASAAVICTTTNVTSASAIAATGTITFSATYFV